MHDVIHMFLNNEVEEKICEEYIIYIFRNITELILWSFCNFVFTENRSMK